ncbi:MAG: 30S ribosomal protein S2 [Candidatus Diapherotrites archaeon]|nr:30S ribosomal protein S2 [Candidatus Diapherotrites archaeon]
MTEVFPTEKYLEIGAHLGTELKTGYMKKFIFKSRKDGLKVLDIETVDKRLKAAAILLAQYKPSEICLVARRSYGQRPVKKAAKIIGAESVTGRFLPGLFTNPIGKEFIEPKIILIVDPQVDKQAIKEAVSRGIPIIALATTMNKVQFVDLVVPINNRGKKALALAMMGITKEILKARGELKSDEDFKYKIEDFEYTRK